MSYSFCQDGNILILLFTSFWMLQYILLYVDAVHIESLFDVIRNHKF